MIKSIQTCVSVGLLVCSVAFSAAEGDGSGAQTFEQLERLLPTPNTYRTASGAPGHAYWQQRVDYVIEVSLDEDKQRLTGTELISYHNNSPDSLNYLWLQLDANVYADDAAGKLILSEKRIERIVMNPRLETADIDVENNHWPWRAVKSRFQLYKDKLREQNPMQESKDN